MPVATLIKMRESCTLVGDRVMSGERAGGKVIPWGRTLEVDGAGQDSIPADVADKMIAGGLAIAMSRVVFDYASGPYNAGDSAAFPEKEADILVKAKKAHYATKA